MSADQAEDIRRERLDNARAKKKAYDSRPEVKQRKLLIRYQGEHAGVEPEHQIQAAPIAQKYAIPVEPRAPLVVEARNLMGPRPAVLIRPEPELAIDPAFPYSWASMLGFLRIGNKADATFQKHARELRQVFEALEPGANVEELLDLTPYFRDYDKMIAAIDGLRQQNGELYAVNSKFGYVSSVTQIGGTWHALRIPSEVQKRYLAKYAEAKAEKDAWNAAQQKEMTAFPFKFIMDAVGRTFRDPLSP